MNTNVFGGLALFTDKVINGLAEEVAGKGEQLLGPEMNGTLNKAGIAKKNTEELHRIRMELVIQSKPDNCAVKTISTHFPAIKKNLFWIDNGGLTKAGKAKSSMLIRNYRMCKNQHKVCKKSFVPISLMQAEGRIIDLINNYLTAL